MHRVTTDRPTRAGSGHFSQILRELMEAARISISELARQARVPRSSIYRHLAGDIPQRRILRAYAAALNRPYTEILALAGYPVAAPSRRDQKVRAITIELTNLDDEDLQVIWQLIAALQRAHQRAPTERESEISEIEQ